MHGRANVSSAGRGLNKMPFETLAPCSLERFFRGLMAHAGPHKWAKVAGRDSERHEQQVKCRFLTRCGGGNSAFVCFCDVI